MENVLREREGERQAPVQNEEEEAHPWEVVKARSLEEILEQVGPHLPMMLDRIGPIGLLVTLI